MSNEHDPAPSRASLVESIPQGLEDLRGTPGIRYTEDVLVARTNAATSTIDLTAMYWALLPDPDGVEDHGFTEEQLDQLGATTGRALFQALREAAARGVRIRILQSPGFGGDRPPESSTLRDEHPDRVEVREIDMGRWYGGSGIMHQKVWTFDDRHLYLGSANMDWKSITQVKELGVLVEDCPALVEDARRYFQTWWDFCALPVSSVEVFDPSVRLLRTVPAWSELVPADRRAPSPFHDAHATPYDHDHPLRLSLGDEVGHAFITGCPPEVRGPGRSPDGDGLVYTIDDARRCVSISVMDFAPVGMYGRRDPRAPGDDPRAPGDDLRAAPRDTPVWWSPLFDGLLSAVLTRRLHVRLLVSKWAHSSGMIEPFLRALQAAADAGRRDAHLRAGQLEIKQFIVPGWDRTLGPYRRYPGHTRVNHAKYVVTDRRINVGTSNMTWDYFASTAGTSFNADHPSLVRALQAVFDRDWCSAYAFALR